MSLTAGSRLGPYEILAPLGAGGMGEVYRARDTRLERTVAIKVLPTHLSASPEVRQRFEREAKTISQLSHPHICALYDVGHQDGTDYLVMEYLEGETLSDRLGRGALTFDQTLRFGTEISDALGKAHRQGIVHRDLKPGNVMITKSGVKLLDFGLAKAIAPATSPAGLTALPTQANLTQEGTILGTFQYMAPEQLEGKEADTRTDIFALGCVLYEMATGKKAFSGATQASLISAILRDDPQPISQVQAMSPPALDRIVKTCLAKDPEDRWQSAHDLAGELKWLGEGSVAGAPAALAVRRGSRGRLAWALAAVFAAVTALATTGYLRRAPKPPEIMRFQIFPPEKSVFHSVAASVKLSPDGRQMVFGVLDATGQSHFWVRSLGSLEARKLEGTEGCYDPFWSPDGRYIAFGGNNNRLQKVAVSGGPVQVICPMVGARGGDWNRDDVILLTTNDGASPILRVPASGGAPVPVTTLDKARGEIGHWRPWFLPDGRHFLFLIRSTQPENSGIAVGSLDSKDVRRISRIGEPAIWAPPGFLLFVREQTLMAQPFDAVRLRLTGEPFPVASDVDYVPVWGSAGFSASANGVLAYQSGGRAVRQLVWFDRGGKALGVLGEPGEYRGDPRISPDGKRVATARDDPRTRSADIWLFDVARGVGSRLNFEASWEDFPIWSPDGSQIVFDSNRDGVMNLYQKPASGVGTDERLVKSEHWKYPQDWSRDGRHLVYQVRDPKNRNDLWVLPLFGDRKPTPLLSTPFSESEARFSPDGRWFAYVSDESGRQEVYVQPFPPTGAKWQISVGGGSTPRWRGDGSQIIYLSPDYMHRAVAIRTEPTFEAGVPQDLFRTPLSWGSDVTSDGERFLVNMPAAETPVSPITVVVNWTADLTEPKRP
ncbi:MAG: serine/threonine-protein kinase [Thermoanaerobaculia bacterium]|nr:serine/threonine-protein kinase [Thermoanaerobaculia bacterium]